MLQDTTLPPSIHPYCLLIIHIMLEVSITATFYKNLEIVFLKRKLEFLQFLITKDSYADFCSIIWLSSILANFCCQSFLSSHNHCFHGAANGKIFFISPPPYICLSNFPSSKSFDSTHYMTLISQNLFQLLAYVTFGSILTRCIIEKHQNSRVFKV